MCGRQLGAGVEVTAHAFDAPNDVYVQRCHGVRPGLDAKIGVDNGVPMTMLCQRPMAFHYSDVETWDGVGVLETSVDDAVDDIFSTESANIPRNIVSLTLFDVFRPTI